MERQEPVQPTQSQPRHQLRCPICRRPLHVLGEAAAQGLKSFPFCSERCKLIDLGAWLDGDYRIPARPDDPSDDPQTDDRPASD